MSSAETGSDALWFDFPLDRPHAGLPMANGEMGVLVFGSSMDLCLCVSLASCWDHRFGRTLDAPFHYAEIRELHRVDSVGPVNAEFWNRTNRFQMDADPTVPWWTSSRVGGGRFRLRMRGRILRVGLIYASGTVSVETEFGCVALDIDLCSNRLWVEDGGELVVSVVAEPMWDRMSDFLRDRGYRAPSMIDGASAVGWHQPMPSDPGMYAVMRRLCGGWVLDAGLSDDGIVMGGVSWSEREPIVAGNLAWWSRYWERVPSVHVSDAFFERFFRFAVYKFAAATHPRGSACSLQGPWLEDYQPAPWSCDYHFNVNVQQVYSLAFQIGATDHLVPLFDLLESDPFLRGMRRNAKMVLGIDDGFLLCHAVDDRGVACGGISTGSMLDFVCGGWTAMLYWWHYRATGDMVMLRDRGYPFMCSVMNAVLSVVEERNGRLSVPLAPSAEYGYTFKLMIDGRLSDQNLGRDPSNLLTCVHVLARALMEASRDLGMAGDPRWEDLCRRLPKFSVVDGRVAVWDGQDLDVCHRHHSHLSMVYPFDLHSFLDESERRAVDGAIDHWISLGTGKWSEWCYPWAAIIHARSGMPESAVVLLDQWRRLFVNEALSTVYLPRFRGVTSHRRSDMNRPRETSEIMQLDGTMGCASALLEMLVHERAGIVRVFPGVPQEWDSASFDRVRVGRLEVSAVRKNGRTVSVSILSPVEAEIEVEPWFGAPPVTVRVLPGIRHVVIGE